MVDLMYNLCPLRPKSTACTTEGINLQYLHHPPVDHMISILDTPKSAGLRILDQNVQYSQSRISWTEKLVSQFVWIFLDQCLAKAC